MPSTSPLKTGLLGGALLLSGACRSTEAPAPPACCQQPEIPAGVKPFEVVEDEQSGPPDGAKVVLRLALQGPVRREEIYPVLHVAYRHAMKRSAFEPVQLVADVYPDAASARQGGDAAAIARISRGPSDIGPRCDVRLPFSFAEQVERAFQASLGRAPVEDVNDTCRLGPAAEKPKPRLDESFSRRPSFKADEARRAVTVSFPYLQMGKDAYVESLGLNAALTYWIEFVTTLFRRVEELKEVTYVGLWRDEPVLTITVTRPQFEARLAALQEEIAAHGGVTFQTLGLGRTNDKQALREQEAFKARTYKAALGGLPRSQVSISPQLK
jgi:hypothetical protein